MTNTGAPDRDTAAHRLSLTGGGRIAQRVLQRAANRTSTGENEPRPRQPSVASFTTAPMSPPTATANTPPYSPPTVDAPATPPQVDPQSPVRQPPAYSQATRTPATPNGQPPSALQRALPAVPRASCQENGVNVPLAPLHADFNREARQGDTVLYTDCQNPMGFVVHFEALRRVCPAFYSLVAVALPAAGTLPVFKLKLSSADAALLLGALLYGTPAEPRVGRAPLTVGDYNRLLALYSEYKVQTFAREILVHSITLRAHELCSPLGAGRTEQAPAYLKLASTCRSVRLWEYALRYAPSWQAALNPWRASDVQTAELGDAYNVLLALEALKNTTGARGYDSLRVTYTADDTQVYRLDDMGTLFTV